MDGSVVAVAVAAFPRVPTDYGNRPCPFSLNHAHDFDAHTIDSIVVQLHCRACGLVLPDQIEPDGSFIAWRGRQELEDEALARVVHTYKGEGLTACGLEVVGPCPDCAEAAT